MGDNLLWLAVMAFFTLIVITSMITNTIEKVKKAKNVIDEISKVPNLAYWEIKGGMNVPTETSVDQMDRDDNVMQTCEEALSEPETSPEGG